MAENRYLKYIIFLILLGGIFKIQTQSYIKKNLFKMWRVILNFNILYVLFAACVDLDQKGTKQFDPAVLNFVYIFVTLIVFFKANYYYFFDGKSEDIFGEMHCLFKYRTETQLVKKDLKESIDLGRNLTAIWFTVGVMTAQGFILMFLIFSTSSERKLPLPFWFPYNWKITPLYELSILYQCFIHQVMVVVVVGWEIKHLLYTVLLKNGVSKKFVNSIQGFINRKRNRVYREDAIAFGILNELLAFQKVKANLLEDVKHHIQFHQSLLKFCHRLEEFFSPMYLPYFSIYLIIYVFISFIITTTKVLTLRITVGLYMIAAPITLILGCYFGQLLTARVNQHFLEELFFEFIAFIQGLQQDVYNSLWYIRGESFMLHIKFLHLNTCKPIVLTVGKIAPLHLNTFLWILKTVTSYVTILYQLTEKNRYGS